MAGLEGTGRYMDDSYYIHTSKEHLKLVLACIEILCEDLGITINRRKTGIVKLSKGFTFLKKRFSYGPTGKVVVRPCSKSVTVERRKLKAHARMVADGTMTREQADASYQSWRGSLVKKHGDGAERMRYDAHRTVLEMDRLYRSLFNPESASGGGSPR